MKYYFRIVVVSVIAVSCIQTVKAVPPPDFIFNIGSQIVQAFSFLVLGLSLVVGALRRFLQTNILFVKYGKLMWVVVGVIVVILSFLGAYYYDKYKQDKAYTSWVEESRQYAQAPVPEGPTDNLDRLQVGQLKPLKPRGEPADDAGMEFIETYYQYLANGNTVAAYKVSSKIVSYDVYQSWYENTTGVSVDSIQKIAGNMYSLGLTLHEKSGVSRYAVLMTLGQSQDGEYRIESSEVRLLATEALQPSTVQEQEGSFYEQNKSLELSISNEDFKAVTESESDAYILDAREDEEFEIGNFPGSHHIRFADLKAGRWIALPQDKVIYVLCWSGIRGKEVATVLRTKNLVARYLVNGADGWVDFGGKWDGGVKFLSKYREQRYQIVFTTEEAKKFAEENVMFVDSRNPVKYQKKHIPGSVSIPVIYTPTSQMETVLAQVPAGSRVLTVCDDFVSCFDAKITGVKLEKKGLKFLGRYNKPWEW